MKQEAGEVFLEIGDLFQEENHCIGKMEEEEASQEDIEKMGKKEKIKRQK